MITLEKTNSAAISSAIRRAHRNQGVATGLVYTLVVVCEARRYQKAFEAALEAGREHPSRILIVVTGSGKTDRLDAEIRTNEEMPGDVVTLRASGQVAKHVDSVVRPLLLPDSPVVIWWPNESPQRPADDPVGKLGDRRITDAGGVTDAVAALRVRAQYHAPGDTDLTWTRLTPWRALLAASLDQYPARVESAVVEAARNNAPAELLAAWLESRLGVPIERKNTSGPGITGVRLITPGGEIAVLRQDGLMASYEVPGEPKRLVALKRRSMNELLTEELRRMDADNIFEDATLVLLNRHKRDARAAKRAEATAAKTATKKTTATKATAKKATGKTAVKSAAGLKSTPRKTTAKKSDSEQTTAQRDEANRSTRTRTTGKA